VPVPPLRNTFVVNLGEALSFISGGKIKATTHQVKAPPEQLRGHDSERTSIPFFFTPRKDAVLTPMKETTFKSHYDSSNDTGSITFQQLLDRVVNGLHVAPTVSNNNTAKAKL
jgi:isopenicillin N synthase-like dioxygenase